MPERQQYHHGNLRAALLTAAEQTLREHGIEQVTLRDLARQAGVSHAAPCRHFRDRQALFDALAAAGHDRLSAAIAAAVEDAGDNFEARLRAVGTTYVRFAIDNAALLALMHGDRTAGRSARVPSAAQRPGSAAQRPGTILAELIRSGHESGELHPGDPERLQTLILATFQGIATLVSNRKIPVEQTDALVADATALFTNG